jgi:hypothetical protein
MSVRLDGRSRRVLTPAGTALKDFMYNSTTALPPIEETNYRAIITLLFIVIGGTCLTVATVNGWVILYYIGLVDLSLVALWLIFNY